MKSWSGQGEGFVASCSLKQLEHWSSLYAIKCSFRNILRLRLVSELSTIVRVFFIS